MKKDNVTPLKVKRIKKKTPTLPVGERLNPDNLRYVDGNSIVDEGTGGYWSSEIKAWMSAHTLKGLFATEDWVYIIVDSVALPISFCPIGVFYVQQAENGKNTRTLMPQHPVSRLFQTPNEYQSSQELSYSLAVDTILGGNGFLWHSPLNRIYNLAFERVQYNMGRNGVPESLWFYPEYQQDVTFERTKRDIPLCEVVHAKRPNPSSAIWGLSPFIPGRKSVLFNRYSADYLLAYYLKGATPQMILEVENAANQKALVRMLQSFEAAYTGRRNQRRTLILPKGVKATQADSKIVDQQLIELVRLNRETILNTLRVPKHALGLQEAGSLGSREHELALRWFWKQTILPTMAFIENALTKHFRETKQIAENQIVGFDTSEVDYMAEDLLMLAETSEKLAGTWTINERRERIFAMSALPDGDRIATAPVPAAPVLPFMSQQPETRSEETAKLPEEQEAQKPFHERIVQKYSEHLRANKDKMLKDTQKTINKMTVSQVQFFADQTEIAVRELRKLAKPERADEPISAAEYKKNLAKAFEELEDGYLDDYNEQLDSTMEVGYGAQVGLIFDPKAQDAIAAYQQTDVKGQRDVLKARGLEVFKSVSGTTTDRVTEQVQKGLEAGNTVSEISDSIVKYMKEQARWRADMIARTETMTAFSIGGMAAMERTAEVIPDVKKMWVTANDEDVRESHKDLMGNIVDADAKFKNGLRFPRDPASNDAAEVIQCRCVSLMLPPEDVAEYEDEISKMSKKPVKI